MKTPLRFGGEGLFFCCGREVARIVGDGYSAGRLRGGCCAVSAAAAVDGRGVCRCSVGGCRPTVLLDGRLRRRCALPRASGDCVLVCAAAGLRRIAGRVWVALVFGDGGAGRRACGCRSCSVVGDVSRAQDAASRQAGECLPARRIVERRCRATATERVRGSRR